MNNLTPKLIVEELDKYIVGQEEAKKAVALAISNRERRRRLPPELRKDVVPKNILMVGPTGVGKTEMATRIATMINAPFLKVEATKFTEVGYVGRDVDSIIHDLIEISTGKVYQEELSKIESEAEGLATERIIGYLCQQLGQKRTRKVRSQATQVASNISELSKKASACASTGVDQSTRQRVTRLLRNHKLEEQVIEIEVGGDFEISDALTEPRLEADFDDEGILEETFYKNVRGHGGQRKRRVAVKEARRILTREEANKLLDFDEVVERAIGRTEESGVVFIDELDKICGPKMDVGRDISGEGVQRDLLPLLEGTTVMTRYGPLRTEHILFIAAGTFSQNKPSDLIPELQGRFPLRVGFKPLGAGDLEKILVEPQNSLVKQYQALMSTEEVDLEFTEGGIREVARLAELMNQRTENIGARRLYTIMERLLEDIGFTASERRGENVVVDENYVAQQVGGLIKDENLSRYIL